MPLRLRNLGELIVETVFFLMHADPINMVIPIIQNHSPSDTQVLPTKKYHTQGSHATTRFMDGFLQAPHRNISPYHHEFRTPTAHTPNILHAKIMADLENVSSN